MNTNQKRRARGAAVILALLAVAAAVFLMWRGGGYAETRGRGKAATGTAQAAVSATGIKGKGEEPKKDAEGKRKKVVAVKVDTKLMLEMPMVPPFTKEQIEAYVLRKGRSEKALVLAGILSPDETYLEEARALNPESKLCDGWDAAKLADEARMGNAEKLALLREKCGTGENAAVYQAQLLQLLCEKLRKGGAADPAATREISDLAAGAREEAEPYFLEKSLRGELADLMTTEGGLSGKRQLLALEYWIPLGLSSDPIWALTATAKALEERAGGGEAKDADAAKAAEGLALSAMAWIQTSREKADNVYTKQGLVMHEGELLALEAGRRAVAPHITDMEAYMADLREERGEMDRLYEVNKNLAFKATDAQWEHFAEESKRLGYLEALKATENDAIYSDFFE